MPERDALQRAQDFVEVGLGYPEELARAEAERCLQCKNPTCIEGCPVNIDIKRFIGDILEGDYAAGVRTLKERNALPAVCGRVCPQEEQCEKACILAKKSEPVAIGRLERFLGDWELAREASERERPEVAEPSGKRVAVVGSGPAGLACAGELARLGHAVTVFESLHAPGGVLVYGIPEFRLPKSIVQAEIDALVAMGVEIVTDAVVGATYTLGELMDELPASAAREASLLDAGSSRSAPCIRELGFDAVFIGAGAGLPLFLGVPGENLNGVYSANEFLTRVNLMKAYDFPKHDTPVWRGRKVAVVGGGNVAMDSARTAKRLGAEEVFLVYRRTEDEMPARKEEVHHAREEGIDFKMLCSPLEILGHDGWVTGMTATRMELGPADDSGRRAPVCVVGSDFTIDCDTVIVALGTRANPVLTSSAEELELTRRGYIAADEDGATSIPGIWAGGDIVTGSATVIKAMGAGKRSASAIHDRLAVS
ncbi:MAG TPA: FAD-dependent oxidoreductase [Coriobacteriia bacterium]|jgi:glutamate synthase (NADPH/NADH) small chain